MSRCVPKPYKWTGKDKLLYAMSMVPLLIACLGALYLLSTYAFYLPLISVALYLLVNVFQAGCCVGCPYRGQYCPAFVGVYLGNVLSGILYKDRAFDQRFFERNATGGEISLTVWVLFPLYWLFQTAWFLIPIYLLLLGLHVILFMPTQCAKCSYKTTCPGGNAWQTCHTWFASVGPHERD